MTTETTSPSIQNILNLRNVCLILIVIGVGISGYLSYAELTETSVQCIEGQSFNCDVVQNSVYSTFMGIPVAYLGFATYLLLGTLLLLEQRIATLEAYGAVLVFGITLFAFLYSVYLVYVQFALLETFCQWCLAHEATITALFILSGLRLRRILIA